MQRIPNQAGAAAVAKLLVLTLITIAALPTNADASESLQLQTLVARADGTVVPVDPSVSYSETRFCDGSKSQYSMDVPSHEGKGEGKTITEAMQNAAFDAVEREGYSQFDCGKCEDADTEPCDKEYSSLDASSAVMSNPRRDCDWDDARELWVCEGPVDFQLGDGPDPYVVAGCEDCKD